MLIVSAGTQNSITLEPIALHIQLTERLQKRSELPSEWQAFSPMQTALHCAATVIAGVAVLLCVMCNTCSCARDWWKLHCFSDASDGDVTQAAGVDLMDEASASRRSGIAHQLSRDLLQ